MNLIMYFIAETEGCQWRAGLIDLQRSRSAVTSCVAEGRGLTNERDNHTLSTCSSDALGSPLVSTVGASIGV